MRSPDWMTRAACVGYDPDLWFPENMGTIESRLDAEQAIAICAGCPVQVECAAYADTENILDGIWGGIYRSSKGVRGRGKQPVNHGTPGGYVTHRRRGEKPCLACTNANAYYARERNAHPKVPCGWMDGQCNTWAMHGATMCWNHLRMSQERHNPSGQNAGQKDR